MSLTGDQIVLVVCGSLVLASAVTLALALFIVYHFRRRRKSHQQSHDSETDCNRIKFSSNDLMFTADQFQHKGTLKVPKEAQWDPNQAQLDHLDVDHNPKNAHFKFDASSNVVFDIYTE